MSDLLLSCVCESDFIMPNLASFLKPSKSSSGGNKTSERSSKPSFRRLSRKENFATEVGDSIGKQTLELDSKSSSSSRPSPRLGLFRRHLGSKSTSVLRKVGSSSRILDCTSSPSCSSSSLATTTSSPFHAVDGSQTRAGMPKCSTVANFGPSKTGLYLPNIAPYKCNSVATFTPSRSGGLSPSRCNSTVSFNLSQCGSTLNFSVSGCDTSQNNLSASRAGSASSLSPAVTEIVYIHCKLCLMDLPYTEMVSLNNCNCLFCRGCMMQYLMFQIKDGNTSISCPDAQCDKHGTLLSEEVESMVERELYEKYQRYLLNEEVDMDPHRTWCPKAGCETICPVTTKGSSRSVSVSCTTCGFQFCSQCKARWHGSQTCDAYARQLAKLSTYEDGLVLSDDENAVIKRCPWCNVPIERDNGCAQMMCKRCKHVFCWYCLTSLDDDFLLRHYDKGPCKNKLGHSRASVLWHRTQVIGIFAGFGLLVLVASPLLLLAAPCILCCKCKSCTGGACPEEENSEAPSQ